MEKKNVIFIVLDTLRKDKVSLYNKKIDFTQNLEKFSKKATIFEDAVSQSPWTLPSHATIFTGEYPWEHGATQEKLYLETEKELLAEKFRKNGYTTACYTPNAWISPYTGMTKGFEEIENFLGILPNNFMSKRLKKLWGSINDLGEKKLNKKLIDFGLYFLSGLKNQRKKITRKIIKKSKKFIEKNKEKNFFLFLNFMDCHLPYFPQKGYREKHAPGVNPNKICQRPHDHYSERLKADFGASKKLYNAEVDYLDDQLGELFDFIEKKNILEDTVVLIVSDHGENLGEEDMFGHQFSVSEELVSVPLLVRSGEMKGKRIKKQVELRELYELIPSWAGIEKKKRYGTKYALGGYEYPRFDLSNIPEHLHKELGKKLRFVRGMGKKIVEEEGKGGIKKIEMMGLKSKKKINPERVFLNKVKKISSAESGTMLEDRPEIKSRLSELGYI